MIPDLSFLIKASNLTGPAFAGVQGDLRRTSGMMTGLAQRAGRMGRNMRNIGVGMTAVTAPIMLMFRDSLRMFDAQDQAQAQVVTAVQSTAGAAGYAADELFRMAGEMQRMTRFGDEDILKNVTGQLLTFTNITGPEFQRAQMAVLDMSTARGDSLMSTATRLGKALNDPIKGLTALRLAGVDFTEEQKNMIESMVELGDISGAQGVILEELATQYGGQAMAAVQAGTGFVVQATNAWGDMKEVIGKALVPLMKPLAGFIWKIVDGFNALAPEQQQSIVMWGAIAVVLGPVLMLVGMATMGIAALAGAVALLVSPAVLAAAALAAVGTAFYYFKDDAMQGYVDGINAAGEATKGLPGLVKQTSGAISSMADGEWAQGWALMKNVVGESVRWASETFGTLMKVISDVTAAVSLLLSGEWSLAWGAAGAIIDDFGRVVELVIGTEAWTAVSNMAASIYTTITGVFSDAWDWAAAKLSSISTGFSDMATAGIQAVTDLTNFVTEWFSETAIGKGFSYVSGEIASLIEGFGSLIGLSSETQDWVPPIGPNLPASNIQDLLNRVPGDGAPSIDGFRAAGGPVAGGGTYVVGEQGPEIFVPDQSGTIIPNGQIGSVQGMTQSVSAWFQQMFASIGPMTDSQLGQIMRGFGDMSQSIIKDVGDMANTTNQMFDSMGQTVAGNFMGWLKNGKFTMKSLLTMVADTWSSIADMALNQAMAPIQGALSTGFSGLLSGLFGGAMGGSVSPNATGAVVMGPAYFPSRGGMSSMAEQGPEAIMPLERGAGGRLGIRASGSGGPHVSFDVTINSTDPNTTVSFKPSRRQSSRGARAFAGA